MSKYLIIILLLIAPIVTAIPVDYEVIQYDGKPADLDKLETDLITLEMDKDMVKNIKDFFKGKGIKCNQEEIDSGVCDEKNRRYYLTIGPNSEYETYVKILNIVMNEIYVKDFGEVKIKKLNWFINYKVK